MERKDVVQPLALVLGGTNPHKALVENLKSRGYRTVLIDYLRSPPAAQVADLHVCANAFDPEAVLQVAATHKPKLVISACLDRTIPVVAEVSHRLRLPSIYTPENALWYTDKAIMKQIMRKNGIPVAWDQTVQRMEDLNMNAMRYPMVLKPADSTGSIGIAIVKGVEELHECFKRAKQASTSGVVIAEEWLEGREFSIDCIVVDGKCNILLHRERMKRSTADNSIHCYATVSPARLAAHELEDIRDVIDRVPRAFGLRNAPLLAQGFLSNDGQFRMVEIAVRLGGGPSSFRVVKLKTGFDLLNAAVDCNLDRPVLFERKDNGLVYASINLYARAGVLGRVEGVEHLLRNGTILEYYANKPSGTEFGPVTTARNRFGAVVIEAPSYSSLHSKIRSLYNGIRALNSAGTDILDRNLAFDLPFQRPS